MRYLNISQMAAMFDLSRTTVRARLRAAALDPVKTDDRQVPLYDMALAGPALFAGQGVA